MILDAQTLLWNAAALTSDAASTNTYDLGAADLEVGAGEPLALVISVGVAADATTGDETYAFQVIESANANLSSPTILAQRTIAAAALTAGSIHVITVPPGSVTKRYLGAYFDGGGTTPTITVTAGIVPLSMVDLPKKYYADGFTIS